MNYHINLSFVRGEGTELTLEGQEQRVFIDSLCVLDEKGETICTCSTWELWENRNSPLSFTIPHDGDNTKIPSHLQPNTKHSVYLLRKAGSKPMLCIPASAVNLTGPVYTKEDPMVIIATWTIDAAWTTDTPPLHCSKIVKYLCEHRSLYMAFRDMAQHLVECKTLADFDMYSNQMRNTLKLSIETEGAELAYRVEDYLKELDAPKEDEHHV